MDNEANKKMPNDISAEHEILLKAQTGDSESIEKLIINYKSMVRSIVRTKYFLASGGDGDDLVQEGTIGLLKAIREYRSGKTKGSFASFAAICIRSKITDAMRTYSREKHKALNTATSLLGGETEEEYLIETGMISTDPVADYIDEEEKEHFYKKVNSLLTARQSKTLKLYLEGYSYKEIASELDVPTKTVDNILKAAKDKIKKAETIFSEKRG